MSTLERPHGRRSSPTRGFRAPRCRSSLTTQNALSEASFPGDLPTQLTAVAARGRTDLARTLTVIAAVGAWSSTKLHRPRGRGRGEQPRSSPNTRTSRRCARHAQRVRGARVASPASCSPVVWCDEDDVYRPIHRRTRHHRSGGVRAPTEAAAPGARGLNGGSSARMSAGELDHRVLASRRAAIPRPLRRFGNRLLGGRRTAAAGS